MRFCKDNIFFTCFCILVMFNFKIFVMNLKKINDTRVSKINDGFTKDLQPTSLLMSCASAFQQFLDDYEEGLVEIATSIDFTNYVKSHKELEEGFTPYLPYLIEFKHLNGTPWTSEEFDTLYDLTDAFAF